MLHLKTINFYIVRLAPKRAQLMENMATNTYSLVTRCIEFKFVLLVMSIIHKFF